MKKTVWMAALALAVTAGWTTRSIADDHDKSHAKGMVATDQVIGAGIYNAQNEQIASVNDVVMNREGQIMYLVAGTGGLAGLGQSHVAIPIEAAKCSCTVENDTKTCKVAVAMTQEQLNQAPKLEADNRAELSNANWVSQNRSYFKQDSAAPAPQNQELISFSNINDVTARCSGGNEFGQIDDLVIDAASHQARYAILGTGGALGIGKTYTAVPFKAVTFVKDEDGYWTAKVSQPSDVLKTLPKVTAPDYAELTTDGVQSMLKKSFPQAAVENKTTIRTIE